MCELLSQGLIFGKGIFRAKAINSGYRLENSVPGCTERRESLWGISLRRKREKLRPPGVLKYRIVLASPLLIANIYAD